MLLKLGNTIEHHRHVVTTQIYPTSFDELVRVGVSDGLGFTVDQRGVRVDKRADKLEDVKLEGGIGRIVEELHYVFEAVKGPNLGGMLMVYYGHATYTVQAVFVYIVTMLGVEMQVLGEEAVDVAVPQLQKMIIQGMKKFFGVTNKIFCLLGCVIL